MPAGPTRECGAGTIPGLVCDPFLGSGTPARAAVEARRGRVGCDLDARAVNWTRARLAGLDDLIA